MADWASVLYVKSNGFSAQRIGRQVFGTAKARTVNSAHPWGSHRKNVLPLLISAWLQVS